MAEPQDVLPLAFPNNYRWDCLTQTLCLVERSEHGQEQGQEEQTGHEEEGPGQGNNKISWWNNLKRKFQERRQVGKEQKEQGPREQAGNDQEKNDQGEQSANDQSEQEQEKTCLVLNPEALEILKGIKGPIAALTIVGPEKTGKSFLLSQFHQSANFSNSKHMHTVGIWMSKTPKKVTMDDKSELNLFLMDTEGIFGSQTNDRIDHQILSLIPLISSVIVYNTENPNGNDLEKAEFMRQISSCFTTDSSKAYNPSFSWIVRNLDFRPRDENKEPCSIQDYIQERTTIQDHFEYFDVHSLPIPSTDPEVVEDMSNPYRHWDLASFFAQTEEIIKTIISKFTAKQSSLVSLSDGDFYVDLLMASFNMIVSVEGNWEDDHALQLKKIQELVSITTELNKEASNWKMEAVRKIKTAFEVQVDNLQKHKKNVNITNIVGSSVGLIASTTAIIGAAFLFTPLFPVGVIMEIVAASTGAAAAATNVGATGIIKLLGRFSSKNFEEALKDAGANFENLTELLERIEVTRKLYAIERIYIAIADFAVLLRFKKRCVPPVSPRSEDIQLLDQSISIILLKVFAVPTFTGLLRPIAPIARVIASMSDDAFRAASFAAKVGGVVGIVAGVAGFGLDCFNIHKSRKSLEAGNTTEKAAIITMYQEFMTLALLTVKDEEYGRGEDGKDDQIQLTVTENELCFEESTPFVE